MYSICPLCDDKLFYKDCHDNFFQVHSNYCINCPYKFHYNNHFSYFCIDNNLYALGHPHKNLTHIQLYVRSVLSGYFKNQITLPADFQLNLNSISLLLTFA